MGDIELELFVSDAPKTVANFIALAEGKKEYTNAKTHMKETKPFFDGLKFHRCIDQFMIQGGCPLGNGMGDPGYKFDDEFNYDLLGFDKMKAIDASGRPHQMAGREIQFAVQKIAKELGIKSQEDFQKRRQEVMNKLNSWTVKDVMIARGYKHNPKLPHAHKPKRGVIAMANSGPNTNGSQFFINVIDTPHLTGRHTVFGRVIKGMDVVDKISKVAADGQSKPNKAVFIKSVRLRGSKVALPGAATSTSKPTSRSRK